MELGSSFSVVGTLAASWLQDLGLERYEASFRENDVRAEDVRHLTAEDLDGLGVTAVSHRRRLLVAIATLIDDNPAPLQPAVSVVNDDRMSIYAGERRQLTVACLSLVGGDVWPVRA